MTDSDLIINSPDSVSKVVGSRWSEKEARFSGFQTNKPGI
jgi:hypothetical protein